MIMKRIMPIISIEISLYNSHVIIEFAERLSVYWFAFLNKISLRKLGIELWLISFSKFSTESNSFENNG